QGDVGEPAPPVLALAHAVHHRLDGRESFRAPADGAVRRGTPLLCHRVHNPADGHHRSPRPALEPRDGGGERPQGEALDRGVHPGDPHGVRASVDLGRTLRGGGAAVAGSGSEDRGCSYARVTFATVSHVRVVTSLPNVFSSSTIKTGPFGVGI